MMSGCLLDLIFTNSTERGCKQVISNEPPITFSKWLESEKKHKEISQPSKPITRLFLEATREQMLFYSKTQGNINLS